MATRGFVGDPDLLAASIHNLLRQGNSAYEILRYAANVRRLELESRLYSALNGTVADGPFCGMKYIREAHQSVLAPKLLGTYEKEIQPELLEMVNSADAFLDIGCAEGYYTTGIARFARPSCVVGVDVNRNSLEAASLMATMNQVDQKCVFVDAIVDAVPHVFGKAVVMIDVDGSELMVIHEFFTAVASVAVRNASYEFIVETDYCSNGSSNRSEIIKAFQGFGYPLDKEIYQDPSLRISGVPNSLTRSFLDLAICGMEGRPSDQSWLIFKRCGR